MQRFGTHCYNILKHFEKKRGISSYDQGGLLYKAPLTATVFKDFSSCYQHLSTHPLKNFDEPFVYVDSVGVKLVTGVVDEDSINSDGVFALSVAGDGFVEMLALYEAS